MLATFRYIGRATLVVAVAVASLSPGAARAQATGGAARASTTQDTTHRAQARKQAKKRIHRAGAATSQQRVGVQKETSGGEVQLGPDQDSIARAQAEAARRAQMRRDSIAAAAARAEQLRRDSILAAQQRRRDSVALANLRWTDSVMRADEARRERERRLALGRYGFYWGLASGASVPAADFEHGYNTGWNVTIPLGWDFLASPIGVRVDGSYDRMAGESFASYSNSDAEVWSLVGDIKLRHHLPLTRSRTTIYALGGGGMHKFVSSGSTPAANGFATSFSSSSTRWGWNAGAGLSFGFGRSALFIESRYFGVTTPNANVKSAHFVPVILGLTF